MAARPNGLTHHAMSRVHVKVKRKFLPHLLLLRGALRHLETAKEKKTGYFYDWLGAILLSALSIEAIGNTYGEVLIPDWKDFESASPIAKLRLVATSCGINPDLSKHPWATARQLILFRNRIAHAKPKSLKIDKNDCDESNYLKVFNTRLESDLEKMITEDFAKQSCDAVEQIIGTLNKTRKPSELYELVLEGHESHATALNDP